MRTTFAGERTHALDEMRDIIGDDRSAELLGGFEERSVLESTQMLELRLLNGDHILVALAELLGDDG